MRATTHNARRQGVASGLGLFQSWVAPVVVGMLLGGCPARGIGDPCLPESVPDTGYRNTEIIIENSSVQCRTRTCVVFQLNGDPRRVEGTASCMAGDGGVGGTGNCVRDRETPIIEEDSLARVFCSCRCSSPDPNTPLCACTEGFHCVDVTPQGGIGVRGGYCVPNQLCTRNQDCPMGQSCFTASGICR